MKNAPPPAPNPKLPRSSTLFLYLSLAGISALVHSHWVDAPFEGYGRSIQEQFLVGHAPAPIQYRILAPYVAQFLQSLGFSFRASFVALRFAATAACAVLLHDFLAFWFEDTVCLLGVALFFALLPITQLHYNFQSMDLPNLAFTLGAFMLIRRRKDAALAVLLIPAMLNRETPALIPLAWLLYRYDEFSVFEGLLRFAGFCALTLGVYFGLRVYYGNLPYYSEAVFFNFNLGRVEPFLYFFLMFGALIVLSVKSWSRQTKFMRRSLLFAPFFIVFHFAMTIFQEARILLPLIPIFIPAAFAGVWPVKESAVREEAGPPRSDPAGILAWTKTLYVLTFAAFLALIGVYAQYMERTHVKAWREQVLQERLGAAAAAAATPRAPVK
ncbi:MAG: hypothetical protein ACHQ49_15040 [Elusimicrobiota bacterium]